MYDSDSYDRVEEWLTNNGIDFHDCCAACDALLADIFFSIAYPNVSDVSEVKLPEKTADKDIGNLQLSETDKTLLKDFHVDFDSILEKCIASNQAEVWFTGSLTTKVNGLYYGFTLTEIMDFWHGSLGIILRFPEESSHRLKNWNTMEI